MKRLPVLIIGLLFVGNCMAVADTHYVATNGANVSPFMSWDNSAVTITAAVSVAEAGDTVLVTNGVYATTPGDWISLDIGITVTSVNGYAYTIVMGNQPPAVSNGVFNLNASGAVLDGFTITNGYKNEGGGIYLCYGTVRNCLITGNIAGGSGNKTGGGIDIPAGLSSSYNDRLVENCIIEHNTAVAGAGVFGWSGGQFVNCIIRNNSANYCGGLRMYAQGWSVKNCLIYDNNASLTSPGGGGIYISDVTNSTGVINCTIVSNYSAGNGGGVYVENGALVDSNMFINCIIYSNNCGSGSSTNGNTYYAAGPDKPLFFYCCSTSNQTFTAGANNNITNEPIMTSWAGGDYHLQIGSPGMNAGINQVWMNSAKDRDGHSRIDHLSGIVDMGCYEYLPQGALYKFH